MGKFRLSIFSFDTLAVKTFRFPASAVLALMLVLCCEACLHLFSERLPEPVLWGAGETSVKVAQVQRRGALSGLKTSVLILGPSHASLGISPYQMENAIGKPGISIYNGALNGRTYSAIEFVYNYVYAPILEPDVLVLAVSPIILNRFNTRMEMNSDEFFEAPMPKALSAKGIHRKWRIFLTTQVNLYRYRRREANLSGGFLKGRRIVDEKGFHSVTGEYNDQKKVELMSPGHPYQKIMHDFDFGGPSLEALVRILEYAKHTGTKCVLINMPFRDELLSISATGNENYYVYLDELKKLERKYGFDFLDYQRQMILFDKDFRDVDHLNELGAKKLSMQLVSDLKRLNCI